MNEPTPIALEFAAFCRRICASGLPEAVAERSRLCVADHLHAAMRGARSATGALLAKYMGSERREEGEMTGLVFGSLSAVCEIDDVHRDTSIHTGTAVVAAALGAAADTPVRGADFLASVALGYEMAVRLSIAAGERHYYYFHSTATCGAVGAAVAASAILGLDAEKTANAIGIATTSASGLWEDISTAAIGVKHLHSGFAAERGIRAARLASLGAPGARGSLEGAKGFLAGMARPTEGAPGEKAPVPETLREIMLGGLGERWAITRNIFKRYPFCLGCFEPLECIREVMAHGRNAEDAASVLVEMYPPVADLVGREDENGTIPPETGLQAKFSAAFAVALVLAGYNPEDPRLPEEWLTDPAVRRWYPRIRCAAAPDLAHRSARVTVTWKDGTRSAGTVPLRNLEPEEVMARFGATCRERMGEKARLLEGHVGDLPALPKEGVRHFVRAARESLEI